MFAAESGTVTGWGFSGFKQLDFPPGLTNVVAISVGPQHCLALRDNHTVVAWGENSSLQTNVPPDLTNVVAIAAGATHSLALSADGQVVTWGADPFEILRVPVNLAGVERIAAGYNFSVALQNDGTVRAWGNNGSGQTNVPSGLTNVIAIAAGDSHVLALRASGSVVAWGHNDSGQTNVPSGLSNVVMIAAAYDGSLAATADGKVWSWGVSASGMDPPNDWSGLRQLAAGAYHDAVLKNDRSLEAWGTSSYGALTFPPDLTNVIAMGLGVATTLAVVRGPALRTQPESQTFLAGTNATLIATAEAGDAFTYQWLFNGEPLPQATNAILAFSPVLPSHAGGYSVMVSNAFGTMTGTSATLRVSPMRILSQPESRDSAAGFDVTFCVSVESFAPVSYQWLFNRWYPILSVTDVSNSRRDLPHQLRGPQPHCLAAPVTRQPCATACLGQRLACVCPASLHQSAGLATCRDQHSVRCRV